MKGKEQPIMTETEKDGITFQISDPEELPHKAIAIHASSDLTRVRIPEFAMLDDMPYPVSEVGPHFLDGDAVVRQIDIPCTCKVVRADSFAEIRHVVVFMVDQLKAPAGFEKGWSHSGIVKYNEPSSLAKLMTPVDITKSSLSRNETAPASEQKKNTNILSAEGLRNRAQHWNGKTVALVSIAALLLFVGICVAIGFALKK